MRLRTLNMGGLLAVIGCAGAPSGESSGLGGAASSTGGAIAAGGFEPSHGGTGGAETAQNSGGIAGNLQPEVDPGGSASEGAGGDPSGGGVAGTGGSSSPDLPREISRPDDQAADQTKKVKVFILMGQSNMVGMGDIEPLGTPGTLTTLTKNEKKYPYLVDDAGMWTSRRDVYYYDARTKKGGPLTATANGSAIGPELGFGYVLGQVLAEPVLVLKSCIGNRSLGWDLLPPGSEPFQAPVSQVNRTYAGYKDTPEWWVEGEPKRVVNWYAGKQYDEDLTNAKAALANLASIYPDYQGQGYEIAGFVWWQGHKDHLDAVYAERYEQNLVRLIASLRKDYEAPSAKFVVATGCGNPGREGLGLKLAEAQLAVGDATQYPAHAGNVKSVDSRDLWRDAAVSPKNQGYHYNRNAETYLEVGVWLGWATAGLLGK